MAEKNFTLRIIEEERGGLTIKLTSLPENLDSLCVVLFKPNEQIYRVWMIHKPLFTQGQWRTTINRGALMGEEKVMIYCLKRSVTHQCDDFYEVVTQCRASTDSLNQTIDCGKSFSQYHDIDYLTGHRKQLKTELNLTRRLQPPNKYSVLLSDQPQFNKSLLMIFGLKNITYVTTKYLMLTTPSSPEIAIPLTFPNKSIYKCAVVELTQDGESFQCGRISDVVFKFVMTKEELHSLKEKTEEFIQSMATQEVNNLHRTKPRAVMDEIMNKQNGLMKTHMKDNNGDPHSPINNNINGLFFSLDGANHHPFSPFGDRRLYIPVNVYFNQEANLYFADFYCVGGPHIVTLVLTKPGSESDNFCHNFLLELDKMNNPFLFLEDGKVRARESKGFLYIEVFHTEHVNISSLMEQYNRSGQTNIDFTNVEPIRIGDSAESGFPKTPGCQDCNI